MVKPAISTTQQLAQLIGAGHFITDKTPLEIQNVGEGIKFKMDATMLQQLQNAPGFYPIIVNIQPMKDIKGFLEGI